MFAYKQISSSPSISMISAKSITDRIDAEHFKVSHLNNLNKILNFGFQKLSDFSSVTKLSGFEFSKYFTKEENETKEVPCLTSQNVLQNEIDLTSPLFISKDTHKILKRSQLHCGNLILSYTGQYRRAAVINNTHKFLHLGPNVCKLTIQEHDPYFISTFLNCYHGQIILDREKTISAQPTVNMERIRSIPILLVSHKTQKYIGDKVRQAGHLRTRGRYLRNKINAYFDHLIDGIELDKPSEKFNLINVQQLEARLNAEYYSKQYTQIELGLNKKFAKIYQLGELAPVIRDKNKPKKDCIYFEIGDISINKGVFENGCYYKYGDAPNNAQRVFDKGDIAVSSRRPNRGAVVVVDNPDPNHFYSVFLIRLKPINWKLGFLIKEYLRHISGKLLLLQRCTWTTYPVISEDDIATIPVPYIENDLDLISSWSYSTVLLDRYSSKLIKSSKFIIEALIEGQITEQQIIDAQNALEAGDNSLDIDILSKITEKGIDMEGKSLFDDIDKLYELIQESQEAIEQKDSE